MKAARRDARQDYIWSDGYRGPAPWAGFRILAIGGMVAFVLWFAAVILGPIIARIYKWRERQALYHDSDPARYAEAVRAEKRLKRLLWVFVLLEIVVMGWLISTGH